MGVNHFSISSTLQFFIYTGRHDLHVLRLAAALPPGHWCHMAAVSGRGGMRFYLNGELVGWTSMSPISPKAAGIFPILSKRAMKRTVCWICSWMRMDWCR